MKNTHSIEIPSKKCEICKVVFYKSRTECLKAFLTRHRFCSRACLAKNMAKHENSKKVQFKKGCVPAIPFPKGNQLHVLNTSGSKFTSENCSFEKHWNWKGDKAGYSALHRWVVRQRGKPDHCEVCGLDELPEGKKLWFDWANISNTYKRDISDWKMMCKPCHRKHDGGHHVGNSHRNLIPLMRPMAYKTGIVAGGKPAMSKREKGSCASMAMKPKSVKKMPKLR